MLDYDLKIIDQFILKTPHGGRRDTLLEYREKYAKEGKSTHFNILLLAMSESLNVDQFRIDGKDLQRSIIEDRKKIATGFEYYEGQGFTFEAQEGAEDLGEGLPQTEAEKQFSFRFSEDSSSSSVKGKNPFDIIDKEDFEDNEELGRVNAPLDLTAFPHLPGLEDPKRVMGVDVALTGDDSTVFTIRHGCHVVDIQKFFHRDPMEICGYIVKAVDEWRLDEIVVDATGGLGAAVVARLQEIGIDNKCAITPVIFNAKPRDSGRRVINQRAEMYDILLERFREGRISIPKNKKLAKQLAYITFKSMSDGEGLRIVSKKEIRKELGESPDFADSLALAFYDLGGIEVY